MALVGGDDKQTWVRKKKSPTFRKGVNWRLGKNLIETACGLTTRPKKQNALPKGERGP